MFDMQKPFEEVQTIWLNQESAFVPAQENITEQVRPNENCPDKPKIPAIAEVLVIDSYCKYRCVQRRETGFAMATSIASIDAQKGE